MMDGPARARMSDIRGSLAAERPPDWTQPLPDLQSPAHTGSLPVHLTSYIGREQEMAELIRLLDRTRLLTLTGAGGVGKTRLAMRTAADVANHYLEGLW